MARPRNKTPEFKAKANDPVLLVAKETFFVHRDGADRSFTAGVTRIMSNHPWVEGIEQLLEPAGPSRGYEVEQATAAPGERRGE